ncbi:MAG: glycosyltransferase, partial [Planctomycetota bacterium]
YAVSILRSRGVKLQLAICGPTLFGDHYSRVCRQLAEDLRCPVMWSSQISDELRSAFFAASRCIVYPSIHREPFGMVAVEALAHHTPAVVPDEGGIASAIEADGACGGLRFRSRDSGHLAEQIERLLTDDELHRRLAEAGGCSPMTSFTGVWPRPAPASLSTTRSRTLPTGSFPTSACP